MRGSALPHPILGSEAKRRPWHARSRALGGGALLLLIVALGLLGPGVAYAEKKVTVCHLPPGNPENFHTISVGEVSVRAHLAHGDLVGACPTGCLANASLCDDGNACTADTCDANGECQHARVSCEDGNPCTIDLCDEEIGCLSVADEGASCNDLNACTDGDACVGTSCQGTAIPGCCALCDDCEDQDPCTIDSCADGTCANEPRDCAVADKCLAGFCDGAGGCDTAPVSCDDSNVCTDDSCDPVAGCSHLPTANPPEAVEVSCTDGVDNDCDGFADVADSDCGHCGDGVAQAFEECDTQDFKEKTCQTFFPEGGDGVLICDATCTSIDTSQCDDDGFD